MSADPILFTGGLMFLLLAYLSVFNRDRLWRIYNMDKSWRKRNPERTPEWDEKSKRYGRLYAVAGVIALVASWWLVRR